MSTNEKSFHLSDILSVTTGLMLSTKDIGGIYEILNFMTQDSLFTHQLPRARNECLPHLTKQFPAIADIVIGKVTPQNHKAIMDALCAEHGEYHMVSVLPEHAHEFIAAQSELAEKIHPSKILTLGDSNG